ncbi:hypothetical protein AOLI_G00168250 [Acnodon oligacanthus]
MVTLREASMLPCPPCCEEPAACFISASSAPGITPQGLPPLRQGRRARGRCGALQLCLFILELRSHLTLSPAAFSVPKIAYIDLPELNEKSRMQPVLRDYLL